MALKIYELYSLLIISWSRFHIASAMGALRSKYIIDNLLTTVDITLLGKNLSSNSIYF